MRVPIGRPWNDLATTVFLRTFMDESIAPAGFKPFDSSRFVLSTGVIVYEIHMSRRPVIANTTFYAEYKSFGTMLVLTV